MIMQDLLRRLAQIVSPIDLTGEEWQAICNYVEELDALATADPLGSANPRDLISTDGKLVAAMALYHHASGQLQEIGGQSPERVALTLDQYIATLEKATKLHQFPYFFIMWAELCDMRGDKESAKGLYARFLVSLAECKPTAFEAGYLTLFGGENGPCRQAVEQARAYLGI
jgi:hypothetical protein